MERVGPLPRAAQQSDNIERWKVGRDPFFFWHSGFVSFTRFIWKPSILPEWSAHERFLTHSAVLFSLPPFTTHNTHVATKQKKIVKSGACVKAGPPEASVSRHFIGRIIFYEAQESFPLKSVGPCFLHTDQRMFFQLKKILLHFSHLVSFLPPANITSLLVWCEIKPCLVSLCDCIW